MQLEELNQLLIQGIQGDTNERDRWSYIWNSSEYSSQKASPIFRWMWKSCVMGKRKFFWLLLWDRQNTGEMLRRKSMDLTDYSCVLYRQNAEESLFHLFFECHFSKWCWRFVKVQWNTALLPQDMLIRARRQFNSKIFREVIMVAGWTIWCHLNAVIFDGATISLSRWRAAFKDEFALIIQRAKPSTNRLLKSWLSSF
jgi:hypothetical protein